MWAKILLAALSVLMIGGALHFRPVRERSLLATRPSDGPRLRVMTWNIGYAGLENDTRAHTSDLKAVAETILRNDPDAVALQELAGPDQLEMLLRFLGRGYRGAVAPPGQSDRVEAVLVKDRGATFENVPGGGRYALGATFHLRNRPASIVLISAHADAFSAARRRSFTGDVVDWARAHRPPSVVLIAGDFNFELSADNGSNLFTDNLRHDGEAYSYILKYFRDLGRDAGHTTINDRRIDYIFSTPEAVILRRAEVLRGATLGRMDHSPLLVEVAL